VILDRIRLDGRTALIAGAGGGGIGTATSVALAEAGADLVAVDILEDRVRDTVDRVTALGRRCLGITADLRQLTVIPSIVERASAEFGRITYLVNIAGGSTPATSGAVTETGIDAFDEMMTANLRYVYLLCQGVARQMAENTGSSVVNVTTIGALTSCPNEAAYGAAKAGVVSLTRTMAIEWAAKDIRVNAIAPGVVRTPRSPNVDHFSRAIPLGRVCDPIEIASGILFLLSDMASGVTGHTLVIDGGATAKFALW
jgi:NAD(P)-dependent dehydrogenase (short-subunit alcohol dehydrogenase family)